MKGTIFSIEEFAVNDGPGIRTTVFLKGCPLHCAWCHNPEGLSLHPQLMHTRDGDEICGREIEARDLAGIILKDAEILRMNEGGVTFTGGEPTMQASFLCEVLELLGSLHKAVETSGFCSSDVFRSVTDRLDLVMMDIKAVDSDLHQRYTGVGNGRILANLELLKSSGKPFVIRIPLIPGVNDTRDNMVRTAELLKGVPTLLRVELLRYHKTAGAKYKMIDLTYNPPFNTDREPQIHDVFGDIRTLIL